MAKPTSCDIVHCFSAEFSIGLLEFKACKFGLHSVKLVAKDKVVLPSNNTAVMFGRLDMFGAIKWFEDYCRGDITSLLPDLCFQGISMIF